MASLDKSKSPASIPSNLLPIIRDSGVLSDRQFSELKEKIQNGHYPSESVALGRRLVEEEILTEYQTRRFLNSKSHGLVVGRYVILDRLGSGSMGRVYKAHHKMMDRFVAIKIIAPEIVCNEKVVSRFLREMRLVGRLDHPNVIRAFDADQINRLFYIVMEHVQGQSLAQLLKKGVIPPRLMVDYAAQALLGLSHAHSQGIVHRDVKPSNLFLSDDRRIKVLDLGLGVLMEADSSTSFATADGIAVGTVDYMSPEQACGRDVDGRSDLFSLGCSMFHLMTGMLPFPGDSPIERMGKRIGGKAVALSDAKPDVPKSLVRIMERLLAPIPRDRYQTADEAAEALQSILRPKAKSSSPASPIPTAPTPATDLPNPLSTQVMSTPVIVDSIPNDARWFATWVKAAIHTPNGVLVWIVLGYLFSFGLGAFASWLFLGR